MTLPYTKQDSLQRRVEAFEERYARLEMLMAHLVDAVLKSAPMPGEIDLKEIAAALARPPPSGQ